VTLNTHHLNLHSASITVESGKHGSSVKSNDISFDKKNQRCTISFDQELPQSKKATLSIAFDGTMNNHMAGFYRSKYKPPVEPAKGVAKDKDSHYMFR